MIVDPYTPPQPEVDHAEQSKLAGDMQRLQTLMLLGLMQRYPGVHRRAGITKNKGQKRNKRRAQMARESRRMNRARR